jgi:hypothetical protein
MAGIISFVLAHSSYVQRHSTSSKGGRTPVRRTHVPFSPAGISSLGNNGTEHMFGEEGKERVLENTAKTLKARFLF